jgi:hypothetical protein
MFHANGYLLMRLVLLLLMKPIMEANFLRFQAVGKDERVSLRKYLWQKIVEM